MQADISRRVAMIATVTALVAALGVSGEAQAVDVTGEWTLDVQTDAGSGTPTMTFKQVGEAITGTYVGTFGTAPLKGTLKGTAIEISFEAETQGQKVDSVYRGTVEKDTMKGTVSIAGGQLNGTFTGKRK